MRHQKSRHLLGRPADQRKALLRSLTTELLRHEKITTTEARAKALQGVAEKMVSLAKRGDLHARRQAAAYILDPEVVKKLFNETASRYTERQGGYTQIVKIGPRMGDGAPMAVIQLV
ncbi:MAG: 50S ribosomal protein L17 [Bacteroidota bacterium]